MNDLNNRIIKVIHERIPAEANIATVLTDILNIGKESVYRRLRNEINFTFKEIALLATKLEFSLDEVIEFKKAENVIFNMHLLNDSNPFENYFNKLNEIAGLFLKMNESGNGKIRMALNKIPYFFLQYYKILGKFRMYKWMYQTQKVSPNYALSDLEIPKKIMDAQNSFTFQILRMPSTLMILDQNVYLTAIRDIDYFYKRNLISDEEMKGMRRELLESVDLMENYANHGINEAGSEIMLYISSVDLDTSYMHLEFDGKEYTQSTIFSMSSLDSEVPEVCKLYKDWIDSLRKFSTLVSQSGEIQRFEYFNEQRRYIEEFLGKL